MGITVLALSLLAAGPDAPDKALEGTWVVTTARREGKDAPDVVGHRLKIDGDRFEIMAVLEARVDVGFPIELVNQVIQVVVLIGGNILGQKAPGIVLSGSEHDLNVAAIRRQPLDPGHNAAPPQMRDELVRGSFIRLLSELLHLGKDSIRFGEFFWG